MSSTSRKKKKKRLKEQAARRQPVDPTSNIIMKWDTPPGLVELKTDAKAIPWPFGDDYAEAMSRLSDKYFLVYLRKAWDLCKQRAMPIPAEKQEEFLEEQRARLKGYIKDRDSWEDQNIKRQCERLEFR